MSRIDEINAILDELGEEATYDVIEHALRDYGHREVLAVLADRSLAPSAAFEVPVLSTKVVLTDAQIKTLPTTPVVLVPATEVLDYSADATSLPIIVRAFCVAHNVGGYTNITDATTRLKLVYGDEDFTYMEEIATEAIGNNNPLTMLVWRDKARTDSNVLTLGNGNLYDNSIRISCPNDDGDLTGGDAANTLTVTIVYAVFPTA